MNTGQLTHNDFESFVRDTLASTRANPEPPVLELTESVMVTDRERVTARWQALRYLGITIALDDFGTGYAALSYLRDLPVQRSRIDRAFVRDAVETARGGALVNNVVRIGRDLGQDELAEGVRTMPPDALGQRITTERHNLSAPPQDAASRG